MFDVVGGGGSVGGYDGYEGAVLAIAIGGVWWFDVPTKVPEDATRKTRNGSVSARKEGNLVLAPATAAAPIAVPMRPPIDPPLSVALSHD